MSQKNDQEGTLDPKDDKGQEPAPATGDETLQIWVMQTLMH